MTVIIGIVCFCGGAIFGVFWMAALALAKQVDNDMEQDNLTSGQIVPK